MTKSDIARAFSNGKFDQCYPYITEKTYWNTPGEQNVTGKESIKAFCEKIDQYFKSITTNFQELNVIEDERCVAINGTAEFIRDGKRIAFVSSCDVYEFDDQNNIQNIHSYCITER